MKTLKPKKKIKAEITNSFFGIVDRLFDNAPKTVFSEILQNSRRAGATLVTIDVDSSMDGTGLALVISDNGSGIEDMADLLRIRSSGWDAVTMAKEDPAGMGFFCLCRMRNLRVTSKDRVAFMGRDGEAFHGQLEVEVDDYDGYINGTQLSFDWPGIQLTTLREALEEVARYAPIDVMFNDRKIDRATFKPNRVVDEFETDDLTVYIHRSSWAERMEFNFHGLLVKEEDGKAILDYSVAIDVKDTRNLQMVLPARNAIVRNKFYKDLVKQIRARIYQLVADDGAHALPYKNWKEACDLGVDIPPATAALRDGMNTPGAQALQPDKTCVIMNNGSQRGNFQTVAAAMEKNGVYKLYEEDAHMDGYDWYDALPRVVQMRHMQDGERAILQGAQPGSNLSIEVQFSTDDDLNLVDGVLHLPADILIGRVSYGEDLYDRAKRSAGGFTVDPTAKWDEDALFAIIDAAWMGGYVTDRYRKDWNRQRAMDVRKCLAGPDRALEVAVKAVVSDLLDNTPELGTYAGKTIELKCTILPDGTYTLE